MRKICVVTTTRADYGILKQLMFAIKADPELQLQVIATNMHLSAEFGNTYQEILNDGFVIDKKVEMLQSTDSANAICKSIGKGAMGFADAYEELNPDLIVVLGDRYEMIAIVSAALFCRIPVAHIHGGEITEGAYDDAVRHAVTKMSHLHFASTESYRNRIIQMGEQPETVFNVGAMGVDAIRSLKLMPKEALEDSLGFTFSSPTALITFHPVTLDNQMSSLEQLSNLLTVLRAKKELCCLFTYPNSDTDGRQIIEMINAFVEENKERSFCIPSLGQFRYFSALKQVDFVLGNSSSGIIEVPSFGIPTVNIGIRQKGRLRAESVIDCAPSVEGISKAIDNALNTEFARFAKEVENPYFRPDSAQQILHILKTADLSQILQKRFYDIPFQL
ncbi:MAG: UDP-N-acetylglucosamine 2-epimerase [Bacteroidales bacterium]|nr:UDP-N-acetylglucosamine 2-epimerase [Bacteroidales bacterium]